MNRLFRVYRYDHADGTAKEWGYADLGNGLADIRWGRAGQLVQRQQKPLAVAQERAREKERKGYRSDGWLLIDAHGQLFPTRSGEQPAPPSIPAQPQSRPQPQPKPKPPPIDIATLLGGDDAGFYF